MVDSCISGVAAVDASPDAVVAVVVVVVLMDCFGFLVGRFVATRLGLDFFVGFFLAPFVLILTPP